MTQIIKIRGSNDVYEVQDNVYPYPEGGITYLKMVTLNALGEPDDFLCVQPLDILSRRFKYTEEHMQALVTASKLAQEHFDALRDEDDELVDDDYRDVI